MDRTIGIEPIGTPNVGFDRYPRRHNVADVTASEDPVGRDLADHPGEPTDEDQARAATLRSRDDIGNPVDAPTPPRAPSRLLGRPHPPSHSSSALLLLL
jgi:hypothetical protein